MAAVATHVSVAAVVDPALWLLRCVALLAAWAFCFAAVW